jgi:hypothetical protein
MAYASLHKAEAAKGSAHLTLVSDQSALRDSLGAIGRTQLHTMYDGAAEAIECVAAMANRGKNPVTEVLDGVGRVEEWAHFPEGDVIDPATHSQFYYHAHASEQRASGEHGHFHTFVRPKHLLPDVRPLSMADNAAAMAPTAWVAHVVGISTDELGNPIRLFTTNRWVTDEVWYTAEAVIAMLDRFDMTVDKPSADLNRWVSAIIRLYRPQIASLLRRRDAIIAQWRIDHPARDVFEDRQLQIVSEMPIDFLAQIRAVEAALTGTHKN